MRPDLGNGEIEADALLPVDAFGTVDPRAAVFSQLVLPVGNPKVAGPLEAGTVKVIETHADPVLEAGFVGPFQRELPGIDALVQQSADQAMRRSRLQPQLPGDVREREAGARGGHRLQHPDVAPERLVVAVGHHARRPVLIERRRPAAIPRPRAPA